MRTIEWSADPVRTMRWKEALYPQAELCELGEAHRLCPHSMPLLEFVR